MKYSLALISSFAAVCLTGPVENAVAKPQPTQQPMSEDELLELKIAARTYEQVAEIWSGGNITCKAVLGYDDPEHLDPDRIYCKIYTDGPAHDGLGPLCREYGTLRGVQNGKLDELIEICNKAYHGGNMNVWEWTKRRCAALRSTDEYLVRIRELAVNGLLYSCSVLETNPPNNEDVRTALEERCGGFETEEEMVDKGLKEPQSNEAYQKELVAINCPPGWENKETQSAATPTSPEPTPELFTAVF
ncbi:hypothetical protein H633G_06980 [Metarhizium anisopliae BRIP 53284]|nr:hypothetical protein H633G_06980 [Metarhizium anisopliae BRIP 53284]